MTSAAGVHPSPVREAGVCSGWPKESGFIREVLDRIGDKWTILIIGTLRDGPLRYTELHSVVPGISQRMLTLTLQQLARDGLVTRTAHPEVPPRVEYALTPLGRSLLDVVMALSAWAVTHYETVAANRRAADEATR
ncbi:DNA-binding HxlR family transcriptional regulator [Friedmanniella endophytica]|uniref:DNA-binding HxlR family transcriptional regulator n=1 Tax=Microlunatus kandeliicorticis TaxID=1759536 RepID=A0A7W3P659_9ACTN|nr:helix-turn-helix domain-containing protein [Microlunatus kandeliicorticis]MBA8794623.1 DNA-binding HxlR family transcriptional regulator [Microlunatus kandeliicorticis]